METVYGITSLPPARASAERLLDILRDHWRIENCLHYVRDVTLGEDACRVRKGSAAQVLAGLRNAIIHLLTEIDEPSRPAALERLNARPTEAADLIGISWIQ